MEYKSGKYTTAGDWSSHLWGEARYQWNNGRLKQKWATLSDWKPVQFGNRHFEPVFHAVLNHDGIYVPALGGTVYKIDRNTGAIVRRFNPFGSVIRDNIFVVGPLSADRFGNIYYNAVQLNKANPAGSDAIHSWLVKIRKDGRMLKATFAFLTRGAIKRDSLCEINRNESTRCGSQRPTLNVAPAIAQDGTIYTISRAHFNDRYGYLVAITPGLKPKWIASLRDRLNDGCGISVPTDGTTSCLPGTPRGADPETHRLPAGRVSDSSTSSPVIAPDGSILYGAYTAYNCGRGHLFRFSSDGDFLGAYNFGWDMTPAIYSRGDTYSIVIKENHYARLSYCEPDWYITQLDRNLRPQWKFENTNTRSCKRKNGKLQCVNNRPEGFDWCVNAVAVDRNGVVYASSEDGNLYAIKQGGFLKKRFFLQLALGAAYTPMTIGSDGRIYAQNAGQLFVLGASRRN